jgi:DNA-binding protein HU-beta
MNKTELVEAVATATGGSKADAQKNVDAVLDSITKALKKGDRVAITGFGSFEVRKRAARTARNPQTGEPIKIKAAKVPAFKPGQGLKDAVSGAKKK